ncbi:MAG: c-type cytochrome [Chitinophagaceae bacterium]|nr:MAG: c-type cytochrome [Chitinophagaceae bacterium]
MPKQFQGFFAAFFIVALYACSNDDPYRGWTQYKGSDENIHYSSLREVDTSNVKHLQVAWEYQSGDADTANFSQIQCNPIVIDGVMYGTTPQMKLFALEAISGKERWVFNPLDSLGKDKRSFFIMNNCRGVAHWRGGDQQRIFYTAGSHLYSINALTGTVDTMFGERGKVDLHDGLGRDVADFFITATSPGIIFNDLLIMGARVDEGARAAPGHIRAFDVRTGRQQWIFHTIPKTGEAGHETWDDPTAQDFIGGANCWTGFSLDKKRGIVYASTGSASYDFYGGRRKGDNLFANSVLALDAATGKRRWHYQYIHHDVWDRDLSSAPALVTLDRGTGKTDAVAVTTKTGYVFVFNRETGVPLFDIEERPVPAQSELEGEQLSATQPYPVKPGPFMRQQFTESDINPYLPPSSYEEVKTKLVSYRNGHVFEPPSLQGTVFFPGLDGGAEWGGPSFDPETGILYVNSNEMPWVIQAVRVKDEVKKNETESEAGKRLYVTNCMSCHGPERKGSGNNPSLINVHLRYSERAFDTLVQSGRRMMPAFKQLTQAERTALATFVLNVRSRSMGKFTDSAKKADDIYRLPYTITGYNKFLSKEGLPAISPPWGTLNAIDLNTGELLWQKTLGHDERVKNASEATGSENYGAGVVTAGGLIFIAGTRDANLRAFNKRTGEIVWEAKLPAAAFATPAVYELNGNQYITVACGGGKMGTRSGDTYITFALPAAIKK